MTERLKMTEKEEQAAISVQALNNTISRGYITPDGKYIRPSMSATMTDAAHEEMLVYKPGDMAMAIARLRYRLGTNN